MKTGKLIILFAVLAIGTIFAFSLELRHFVGNQSAITPGMLDAMADAVNQYALEYPTAAHNTPHECRIMPADVCYDSNTESYVVTCLIPQEPLNPVTGQYLFGIVAIKNDIVVRYESVRSQDQNSLSEYLESLGCK